MHMLRDRWFVVFLSGIVLGALGLSIVQQIMIGAARDQDLISEYYRIENLIHVSPHSLRSKMAKGEGSFILVDLRSAEEYASEHIIGAVNIPAYKDKYTSAYDEVDRVVTSFATLRERFPERDLIVYCYSTPCMTGRKIGQLLAEHDIYVKHLNIGWYEWRHAWETWNHEHEWTVDRVEDYIWRGAEPGTLKKTTEIVPCTEGELGC